MRGEDEVLLHRERRRSAGRGAERVVVLVDARLELEHLAEGELDLLLAVRRHREDAGAEGVGVDVLEQAGILEAAHDALVDLGRLLLLEHLTLGLLPVDPQVEVLQRGALRERKHVVRLELARRRVHEDLLDLRDRRAVDDLCRDALVLDAERPHRLIGGNQHALRERRRRQRQHCEQQQSVHDPSERMSGIVDLKGFESPGISTTPPAGKPC